MLHQMMYERVHRMLVEIKYHVRRGIRDLWILFLSRLHCRDVGSSKAISDLAAKGRESWSDWGWG